jgi:hypothetical protein
MAAAGLTFGALVAPAVAKAPELAMLDGLAGGSWELYDRDANSRDKICVRGGRDLIQIRHRAVQCSRYVVEDGPKSVVVQYTCPGDGYGRTSIRRETGQLVQIDSQGIENGMPFHLTAEARRVGACRG